MVTFADPLVFPDDIEPPRFFSYRSDTEVTRGNLPHWQQNATALFVTFRLADSLPQSELDRIAFERKEWLQLHPQPWPEELQRQHDELFSARIEKWLDDGHGECLLKDVKIREIVEARLRNSDGEKYRLYAFVVMPNHVHVVFMPLADNKVADIVQGWKSVSSRMINRQLSRHGAVWMAEYFDRSIRNAEHFERAVRYTLRNNRDLAWSVFG